MTLALQLAVRFAFAALVALSASMFEPKDDPIERVERWIARYDGEPITRDKGREAHELDLALDELFSLDLRAPERRFDVLVALLDLAAIRPIKARPAKPDDEFAPDAQTQTLRVRAQKQLAAMLAADAQGELAPKVALKVLADAKNNSLERRIAAVELFTDKFVPSTELALLNAVEQGEPALRRAAFVALEGWPDEAVHRVMARELERSLGDPNHARAANALRHFERVVLPSSSPSREIVRRYLAHGILDADWHKATRAIQVTPSLQNADAVPLLIEALANWIARRDQGQGSMRIESELVAELERRAKSRIGPHPESWRTWWRAVQSGAIPANDPSSAEPDTAAAFFGLRPMSDRVVFVIDRSGSMKEPFGTIKHSRWDEATAQLLDYVSKLGPNGRFRVISFSDQPLSSSRELKPATTAGCGELRTWISTLHPGGGTELQAAIYDALELTPAGLSNGAKLEADTIVVLCDGETAEGPSWVAPLLAHVNPNLCVKFFCVLVGPGGDGTLEALAQASRGQFLRVSH